MNEAVTDNLNNYLGLEKPEYAFLVSGGWGVGKTSFVKNYFDKTDKKEENSKLVWISLFGLKSCIDIDQSIFQSLHPILGSKFFRLSKNIFKGALSLGVKVDLNGDGSSDSVKASLNGDGLIMSMLGDNYDDIIIVFDDLERTGIDNIELLGYINKIVEDYDIKVIIIANEDKLLSDESCHTYKDFKEKVIGKTFTVDHDFDSVLKSFLEPNRNNFLMPFSEDIKQAYQLSEYYNLRKVKQSISDFVYVYDNLNDKHKENVEFLSSLIKSFFLLSFELKKGSLTKDDLLENKIFSKSHDIYKRYFSYYPNLYDGKVWMDVLFNGDLSSLSEKTSMLSFFSEPKVEKVIEKPVWLKLWNYRDLEDEEFYFLINQLSYEIKNSEVCNVTHFLHKISNLIFFSSQGLIDINIEELKEDIDLFLNCHKDNDIWLNSEIKLKSYSNGTGYQYLSDDNDVFLDITKKIVETNNNIYHDNKLNESLEYKSSIIKSLLSGGMEDINEILLSSHRTKPIFTELSPKDFIKSLKIMKNESIKMLSYTLRNRYLTHDSLNGVEYGDYLTNEVDFWNQTKKILDSEKEDGLKYYIIREFSEKLLTEIISRLSRAL
ncbi:KAP family NTPase [Vibrio fluvialis]|uniref:P-loop NTPase fold protein n=1 Tax=Vibrio fluvialis TaxID=676 RepID=UPI001F45EBC8|nr:P-loop NTPase fold protein [Vibrio fluvialis]MCE7615912.1 KAP family NTPase [Vibrio fluvialis]